MPKLTPWYANNHPHYKEGVAYCCYYIKAFQISPLEFYKEIETTIQQMKMPGVKTYQVKRLEEGLLGTRRVYLRIVRHKVLFNICCAHFGRGFFISWRQRKRVRGFFKFIPIVGATLEWVFYRKTYYRIDAENIFEQVINQTLHEVVDTISRPGIYRRHSDLEKKPVAKRPSDKRRKKQPIKKPLY